MLNPDRLKKLAQRIDEFAEKDERLLEQVRHTDQLRREAAGQLHRICGEFVEELNTQLTRITLELGPATFAPEDFLDPGVNLIQINARGRLVQISFQSTDTPTSTDSFRIPYILHGAVRCFNQDLLEQANILEESIFYCLEKKRNAWHFFNQRTYRSGLIDQDYLASLMERLL